MVDVLPEDLVRARQRQEPRNVKTVAGNVSTEPKKQGIIMDANAFRKELSTNRDIREHGRDAGHRANWVEVSDDMRYEMESFVDNYVTLLVNAEKSVANREIFRRAMLSQLHQHDRLFLEHLTKEEVGADGRTERVVDKSKIGEFLKKNPEGWSTAMQVLEDITPRIMYALGIDVATDPAGNRLPFPRNRDISTGMAQGPLNKLWRGLWEFWGTPAGSFAGRRGEVRILNMFRAPDWWQNMNRAGVAGALIGSGGLLGSVTGGLAALFTGSPEVAATAAAVGLAAPTVAEGASVMFGRGVAITNVTENVDSFNIIRNSPAEAAFMKAVLGFDVRDYEVVNVVNPATGLPEPRINRRDRANWSHQSTISADTLQKFVFSNILTRIKFYKEAGFDEDKIDALPEQFLTLYTGNGPEQTGSYWEDEYVNELNNAGGIRDGAGNRSGDPACDFDINGLDRVGNLRRSMRARGRVITRTLENLARKERLEVLEANRSNSIGAIDKRISDLGNEGAQTTARKEDLGREKTALEADKTSLEGRTTSLREYDNVLGALHQSRDQLARELRRITGPGGVTYPNTEAALVALRSVQNNPGSAITIRGRLINSLFDRINTENTWKGTQYAGVPAAYPRATGETDTQYTRRTQPAYDRIDAEYNTRVQRIQPDIEAVNNLITTLTTLQEQTTGQEAGFRDVEQRVVNVNRALETQDTDFRLLRSWGITEAQLRTETLNQILQRVNARNGVNNAQGWAEGDNLFLENRAITINAMMEALALRIEAQPNPAAYAARRTEFNTIRGWDISEHQLRYLTPEELEQIINEEFTRSGGGRGWDAANNAANRARLDQAMEVAQNRFRVRFAIAREMDENLGRLATRQQRRMDGVNFRADLDRAEPIRDLLERQGDIFSETPDMLREIERFIDVNTIPANDPNFTQAERDLGASRGYYEFINLLFDYRQKKYEGNNNRETYFRQIQTVLNPDRLGTLLNQSLNLGIAGPGIPFQTVLEQIRIRRVGLGSEDLRHAFLNVINALRDEGLAI